MNQFTVPGLSSLSQRVQALLASGLAFMLIEILALTIYGKWDAVIVLPLLNIPLPAVWSAPFLAAPGLGIIIAARNYFMPGRSFSKGMLTAWMIFSIISVFVCSWLMEPWQRNVMATPQSSYTNSAYYESRAYRYYGEWFASLMDGLWGEGAADSDTDTHTSTSPDADGSSSHSSGSSSSGTSWLDDVDGEAVVFIIVIGVVIMYLVGAFFIPNFWIVTSMIAWAGFLWMAWEEYRLEDRNHIRHYRR